MEHRVVDKVESYGCSGYGVPTNETSEDGDAYACKSLHTVATESIDTL